MTRASVLPGDMWSVVAVTSSVASAGCREIVGFAVKFTGDRVTLGHCRGWRPISNLWKDLIPPLSPPKGCVGHCARALLSPASSAQPLQLIRAKTVCLETENGNFLPLLSKSKLCGPAPTRALERSASTRLKPAEAPWPERWETLKVWKWDEK